MTGDVTPVVLWINHRAWMHCIVFTRTNKIDSLKTVLQQLYLRSAAKYLLNIVQLMRPSTTNHSALCSQQDYDFLCVFFIFLK